MKVAAMSSRKLQCSVCHHKCRSSLMCESCQAVHYCSNKCRVSDLSGSSTDAASHRFWCRKSVCYRTDDDIKTFPFLFTADTTRSSFTDAEYKSFLARHGVLDQGLWMREITSSVCRTVSFGDDPFVLPSESVTLDDVPTAMPSTLLQSWDDYYRWRGFHLDSPIAILLQWPLTMYFILTSCLDVDYPNFVRSAVFSLHCVGAGKEVDLIPVITELALLMPDSQFDIRFIGPEISQAIDGRSFTSRRSRLSGSFHRGLYHKVFTTLPRPGCVIGFNAGLVAYASWIESIQQLAKSRIPAYFTEYCWKSYELTRIQMNSRLFADASVTVSSGTLNPFRSPIRIHDPETEIPAFSNAVLFHLEYDRVRKTNGPS